MPAIADMKNERSVNLRPRSTNSPGMRASRPAVPSPSSPGVDFPATIEGFLDWYQKSGLQRRSMRIGAAKPALAPALQNLQKPGFDGFAGPRWPVIRPKK